MPKDRQIPSDFFRKGDNIRGVIESVELIGTKPSIILLTRQGVPVLDRNKYAAAENFSKGGYIISDSLSSPDITIFCSGSEVWLSLEAKTLLPEYDIRVINMGCWELFDQQTDDYKSSILSENDSLLVSIEAGVTQGWERFTGRNGLNIGIDTFGESAPGKVVADYFGLNPESIVKKIKEKYKVLEPKV